jgi:hypothetical protein
MVTCETAIVLRHGTNLPPVIPLDNLSHARVRTRALQCPDARMRRCHARLLLSDVPVEYAGKLAESAPAFALTPRVPSDDLVCRVAPRQRDERGPPCRAIRRLADDFRNVIRCYNEWTSKTSYLPRFVVGVFCKSVSVLGVLECPFRMPVASRVIAFLIAPQQYDARVRPTHAVLRPSGVMRARVPPRVEVEATVLVNTSASCFSLSSRQYGAQAIASRRAASIWRPQAAHLP